MIDHYCYTENPGSSQSITIKRHQTGYRFYKTRKIFQEPTSFPDRFMKSLQIQLLQVAQTAVNDPKTVIGCMFSEIIALKQ